MKGLSRFSWFALLVSLFGVASSAATREEIQEEYRKQVPEKIREISIFDLLGKDGKQARRAHRPKKPALPDDYGEEVARRIQANRKALLECLELPGENRAALKVQISIAAQGVGEVTWAEAAAVEGADQKCIRSILSRIEYPKHPLSQAVTIRFPIRLEREVL